MSEINNINPTILAIICTIITIIPIMIIVIKIKMYKKYFEIAENIKEINNNQEAIIKLLIEMKNKKGHDHKDV